jgi:hypothetical protein
MTPVGLHGLGRIGHLPGHAAHDNPLPSSFSSGEEGLASLGPASTSAEQVDRRATPHSGAPGSGASSGDEKKLHIIVGDRRSMFSVCLRQLGWARPTAWYTNDNGSGHSWRPVYRNHRHPKHPHSLIMLYTIAVILIVLWLLGLVTGYTMGAFIHVLLVIAIIMVLLNVISGRKV